MPPWTVKKGAAAAVGEKVNGEEGKASACNSKEAAGVGGGGGLGFAVSM